MADPFNKQLFVSTRVRAYLQLMRTRDWVKNLVILLPPFFAVRIDEPGLLVEGLLAVGIFCLISSAVYTFNDLQDLAADRLHPQKKFRPLASGAITRTSGLVFAAVLLTSGLAIAALCCRVILPLLIFYCLLNLAYSVKLKYIPIIDLFVIAAGYVIRIFVGGIVTETVISMWIVIMIFLLTLFVTLAKRRDDVVIYLETGTGIREVAAAYNLKFIDAALTIMAAVTLFAYIMYTVSPDVVGKFHTSKLYITTAFVVAGILRYLQMIFVEKKGGAPTEILFTDRFLQACLGGWLLTFGLLIYTLGK